MEDFERAERGGTARGRVAVAELIIFSELIVVLWGSVGTTGLLSGGCVEVAETEAVKPGSVKVTWGGSQEL